MVDAPPFLVSEEAFNGFFSGVGKDSLLGFGDALSADVIWAVCALCVIIGVDVEFSSVVTAPGVVVLVAAAATGLGY